jgi:predicted nucleic acid-binding protein
VIILDTNVVSELMRENANAQVSAWTLSIAPETQFTTAITEAEVFHGIALLPKGKRRAELEAAAELIFSTFAGRILPFDSGAAREYAEIVASRSRKGRPITMADAQIGAIAKASDARLATRNTGDFSECGIGLINPWKLER